MCSSSKNHYTPHLRSLVGEGTGLEDLLGCHDISFLLEAEKPCDTFNQKSFVKVQNICLGVGHIACLNRC